MPICQGCIYVVEREERAELTKNVLHNVKFATRCWYFLVWYYDRTLTVLTRKAYYILEVYENTFLLWQLDVQ